MMGALVLDDAEVDRLADVLGRLALDLTRGLFVPLGLDAPDEEAVRRIVREEVEAFDRAPADDRGAERRFVTSALTRLENEAGFVSADGFRRWARDVYFGETWRFAQLVLWRLVITDTRRETRALPPRLVELVRARLGKTTSSAVPRVPETAWDKAWFERQEYEVHPESPNPMDAIENTILHRAFRVAWDDSLGDVDDAASAVAEVEAWGRREAEHRGIGAQRLDTPGRWPAPSDGRLAPA